MTQTLAGEWVTLGHIDSYEQLTFKYAVDEPKTMGTLAEAKEIFEFYNQRHLNDSFSYSGAPEGWSYLGSGSSRIAFMAPSGVVYKVQRFNDDEYNTSEQANFEFLKHSGKIPLGWRVPSSTLYRFEAMIVSPDGYDKTKLIPGIGAVIALEYVDGDPIGYDDNLTRTRMYAGMEKMGLVDGARGNILRTSDGFCVVDAGEGFLNPDDEVRFAKIVTD